MHPDQRMAQTASCRVVRTLALGALVALCLPVDLVLEPRGEQGYGLTMVSGEAWAVCNIVNGNCDCAALQPYFGANASAAQKIASQESSCNPSVVNTAGGEHSVGLFQINIAVGMWVGRCNNNYSCNGQSANLSAASEAACEALLLNAHNNKVVACTMSGVGSSWGPWGACAACMPATCPGPDNTGGFCGPTCGDAVCDAVGGEHCGNCSVDCGLKTCVCPGF